MTNAIEETDILIVGAGPTGLALATVLRQSGITPVIVDRLSTGQSTSRAAVIHAHTLEVLEQIGVTKQLENQGLKLSRFSIRDRDRTLVRLRFDDLPTRFACLLMLPQDRTERILNRGLVQAGGDVRWGHEVESFTETASGIRATIRSGDGVRTVHAKYVVGADGMHSRVRQAAGIGFTGDTYAESFVLADVEMTWGPGRDEVMLFFSPAGLVVVAPLPEANRFRVVATMDAAPEHPGVADIQALLDGRGPGSHAARVSTVLWSSRFRLHHRVADRYRRGRYLLMGDAAHVHSPAGGQGMNTGLVDACVLGRLLADVVLGRKDDSHLDLYEARRRPAAQMVMKMAGRLTAMATMRHPARRFARNTILRIVNLLPMARRRLEMNLSGLSRRSAAQI
ncbi:MAG: FAD-dependent oxidoreductase [Vicinamibacterales bacterium]